MRDIALSAVFAVLLVAAFRYPVMGAYVWAWVSLMNPHKLTYGFAFDWPFAQTTAIVTLAVLVLTRKRQGVPINGVTTVWLALIAWMTLTSFFALAPQADVINRWVFVMKIQLMLLVTIMLVTEAAQIRVLVWVVTLSVAFYGIKGGIWTLLTGGGGRVWGPPGGMLEGNNELAVGLVILMPMLYFMRQTQARAWLRHALLASMVVCTFSTLGTQSRGALLALVSMALFLGLKGKHPVRTTIGIVALVAVAIAFMPETWSSRMETIQTYQMDGSAMSRLWTWNTLWNVAVDRPLVGAGFQADNIAVFNRYAPLHGEFAVFAGRVYVAHSIYFQMLGEHGFVGLALFLTLGLLVWRMASRVATQAKDHPEHGSWMPMLMRMCQVGLVGYAVGGAFLSLAYLDLPYYTAVFVVLCDNLLRREARQAATASGVVGASVGEVRTGYVGRQGVSH